MESKSFTQNFLASCLLALVFGGCAQTKKIIESSTDILGSSDRMAVEMGAMVEFPAPLPNYYPFYERGKKGELVAKGWDLDRDGKIDKIDVISSAGDVLAQYFDFDGDGKVDLKTENQVSTHNQDKTL